jgi:hypothetical protein
MILAWVPKAHHPASQYAILPTERSKCPGAVTGQPFHFLSPVPSHIRTGTRDTPGARASGSWQGTCPRACDFVRMRARHEVKAEQRR